MAGMDWFRWHHGSVNDPKFQLVAKRAGASVAEVVAVWACLLEAASSADERPTLSDQYPLGAPRRCLRRESGRMFRTY
jgi:hypothetical protein